jgi:hypothetical protein
MLYSPRQPPPLRWSGHESGTGMACTCVQANTHACTPAPFPYHRPATTSHTQPRYRPPPKKRHSAERFELISARCLFFERLAGTNTGPIKIGKWITLPPTDRRIQTPMHLSSIVWNPQDCVSVHLSTDRPLRGQHQGGGRCLWPARGRGPPAACGRGGCRARNPADTEHGRARGPLWQDLVERAAHSCVVEEPGAGSGTERRVKKDARGEESLDVHPLALPVGPSTVSLNTNTTSPGVGRSSVPI